MHTHKAACGVFAMTALLLLAGCDSNRKALNTAPADNANADATADDMPAELKNSIFMSADVERSANASGAEVAGEAWLVRGTKLGDPLAGLTAEELARFNEGRDEFAEVDDVEEGLGPVFNEASCGTCHSGPTGGTEGRVETRFGRWGPGGFDPLTELGGSLLQDHAIGMIGTNDRQFVFVPEIVPAQANIEAGRVTTPLFGLGLVDAVTDATLLQLARLQARYLPAVRGVPNMVTEIRTGATRVGRFGWKSQVPTLHQFSGDAYLNEMGITNPEFPEESHPQGSVDALAFNPFPKLNDDGTNVQKFLDFMTLLGPPPRGRRSFSTEVGGVVFVTSGCAYCHTPTLITGDSPVQALSRKTFHPYSDFLLHDMGKLGDGIVQGEAGPRMMRTSPLWGLSARPTFLHDGRAKTIHDAILEHGGQGNYSRARFMRLGAYERFALLAYLRSL
jgi:di-heme oxidoreductase (putative peroxidase)